MPPRKAKAATGVLILMMEAASVQLEFPRSGDPVPLATSTRASPGRRGRRGQHPWFLEQSYCMNLSPQRCHSAWKPVGERVMEGMGCTGGT